MAEDLHRLTRNEKKNLVRGWNNAQVYIAQQQQQELPNQPDNSSDNESDLNLATDHHHFEPNDRLMQWLRQESAPTSAVSSQWESQFTGYQQQHDQGGDDNEVEGDLDEAIPLTSGQVKHAYRTRARRQEVQDTKKAIEMKVKRETLLGLQNNRAQTVVVSRPKASHQKNTQNAKSTSTTGVSLPQIKAHDHSLANSEQDQQQPQNFQVLELKNLSADRICVDSEYRNETLTLIRKQLISGRDVLLASDCSPQGESLNGTKLMMQQLCAQSLMYCVRDQEVVPRVELSEQRVELLLRTRIPPG